MDQKEYAKKYISDLGGVVSKAMEVNGVRKFVAQYVSKSCKTYRLTMILEPIENEEQETTE